jgi:ATP adenylyltransferase
MKQWQHRLRFLPELRRGLFRPTTTTVKQKTMETHVDLKRIWAPWRLDYVSGGHAAPEPIEPTNWQSGAEPTCFLCRAAAKYADPADAEQALLLVERNDQVAALLNRFPYANGHLLVAPLRHVAQLSDLTDAEHLAAMRLLSKFTQRVGELLQAEGFNVGLNLGQVAGAGVPGHLHWHLVPRWTGDHNFMATLAGVRVIPQSLEAVWEALTEPAKKMD